MIPSAVLALLASLAFGSSDFLAGLVSRRVSSVAVALWSAERLPRLQSVGVVMALTGVILISSG